MKKLLSLLIAFLLLYDVSAQNLELSFTGVVDQSYITLDSIKIMNRTKDCDTLLVYPDTVLSLTIVGLNHHPSEINALSLSQNFPNPFADQTSFTVFLPEKEYLHIVAHNQLGQRIAEYHSLLDGGKHLFTFHSAQDNWYVVTATTPYGSQSMKMSCLASASSQAKLIRTNKAAEGKYKSALKKVVKDEYFTFEIGDTLLLVAYVNSFTGILESGILDNPEQSESYTFQFATNIPCPGTPTVDYEGQIYNTIQIFSQCWLKENLNVGTMIPGYQGMADNDTIEKYCYNDLDSNCDTYGGLYKWWEMMQHTTQNGTQGICPPGWHLPTDEELKVLEGAVDSQYGFGDNTWDESGDRGTDAGTNLKMTSGWNYGGTGTDLFGFSGLPGGFSDIESSFVQVGDRGIWWSATALDLPFARTRTLSYSSNVVYRSVSIMGYSLSVRCIND